MPIDYKRPILEVWNSHPQADERKRVTTYGDRLDPHQTVDLLNDAGEVIQTDHTGFNGQPWIAPVVAAPVADTEAVPTGATNPEGTVVDESTNAAQPDSESSADQSESEATDDSSSTTDSTTATE